MKRIIITSFEEFGSRSINASREVVKELDEKINNFDIKKCDLKVSWNEIESEIDDIILQKPDYIILCGEAASYDKVTVEKCGTDCCKHVDNYNVEIIHDLTMSLYTKIDINSFKDLDINISNNAGAYLCNRSYYLSLKKTENLDIKVLFIHFPLIKEQGGKFEKKVLVQTLKDIINNLEKGSK